MSARLDPRDVEAIAQRVSELLRPAQMAESPSGCPRCREEGATALLTARDVAARFGVSADWVREHADQLGVMRLGTGTRPRLRFDPRTVEAAVNSCRSGGASEAAESPAPARVRRRCRDASDGQNSEILAIFDGPRRSMGYDKQAAPAARERPGA